MKYNCPKCGFNLKQELLRSNYIYLNKHDLLAIYSTPACPKCGSSLSQITSEIDIKVFSYFMLTVSLFIMTLVILNASGYIINPLHIVILGISIFFIFIAYFSWLRGLKSKGKSYYSENKNSNK